jgi:DNA-binding response OmpR family regulator
MANRTRILVLDDEVALLDTLTDYLRECRYTVYPVTQAEEASAHLRCGIVDLAILDIGAHGLRIAREAATNDIPTILISGHPVILESGAVGGDVMHKPFSLAVLRANIEKTIAKHGHSGSVKDEPALDEFVAADLPRTARTGSA